jgi:hypothetical protein
MEDDLINKIAVSQLLEGLNAEQRVVVELVFGIHYPPDWPWKSTNWPPTYAEVGWYVGQKFRNRPLSEAAIRYIRTAALRKLAELDR